MYRELVELYKTESANVFNEINTDSILVLVNDIIRTYENGNKIFACGNGGNAAYVANLITDLNMHPFVSEDKSKPIEAKRLHAINLCESVSTITAIVNDIGPEFIFSEQLKFMGSEDDLLIGLSGSGNSENILNAIETAKCMGMLTHGITRNEKGGIIKSAHSTIILRGQSQFPGQIGKNNNNFHFEDCISKISHIATGILKQKVQGQ